MIGCFPPSYPDELFYSICARYAGRVQYRRKAAVMQELFGSGFGKGAIDLPTHLDVLVAALPPEHPYSVDRFIGEHTLLPFYCPFLPAERLRRLLEEMAGENAVGIYYRFGFRKGSIKPARYLRYCPSCAMEDRIRVGETYWHRISQLPGVLMCPTHMIPLEETSVEALARRAAAPEFYTAEQAIPKQPSSAAIKGWPWHDTLLALARDAAWLLEQWNLTPGFSKIYQRYLMLLAENHFVLPRGRLRLGELVEQFQAHYPDELLDLLQCPLNPPRHHWLLGLVHGDNMGQHPLHHLLLMRLLGSTAEEFFHSPAEPPPFGDGPWPCLNPVSDHYRERMIKDCQIIPYARSRRLFQGTFPCACGFVYQRRGPDQGPEDQFRYEKVVAYGPEWEEALRKLLEASHPDLHIIASRLGTSVSVVCHEAARLGLKMPLSATQLSSADETGSFPTPGEQSEEDAVRERYRTIWLAAMQGGQTMWAADLKAKEPEAYRWLYSHDHEWLKANMPPRKPRESAVDWNTRDQQLAKEIRAAATRLKNRPGRPVRVTVSALSRELGQSALRANGYTKQKLPLASQALDEVVETAEACAVRKIWWAATCFIQEQLCPGRWDLLKRSGVRRQETAPVVQQAIESALRKCASCCELKAG